ncbi:Nif3-like dinuclear metal center hexameric protein [Couchioplanes caeruleus]|uniref:Nif3-like dinuclear metal center hexameric protein n=1 Tax=Couchioplanes caeruleus TaxID=56438 RepID=UPI00201BE2F7|nr:Nif3-like dinuclear metal center hexameric protein [Couchioplanes caeruleus]UQU63351.1 Nif3-like dinuclear metal center hexameric protein [Couchioplanes caeruleus]
MTDSAGAPSGTPTVREVVAALDRRYPRSWAEQWDRVGPVLGEFDRPVRRILAVVDCVPETVEEAVTVGADLIVAHHPLLLKGVSSVAPDTYKGRIVHRLIKADIALYVAHTNADTANPGVSDALAARLDLVNLRPLAPAAPGGPAAGEGRGIGRVGELAAPMTLAELTSFAARRLPATAAGVRAAGDPDLRVRTLAVCGGAGDSFLREATAAGADAYLCADLRHHPAGEHLAAGGPALLDVAHWASERPWLDEVAGWLRAQFGVAVLVSDLDTDPWTVHAVADDKEIHP